MRNKLQINALVFFKIDIISFFQINTLDISRKSSKNLLILLFIPADILIFLKDFSVPQRITKLGLRPDRADVIVPALGIYLKVMKWAGIKKMYVPEVGLADGMVRILYDNFQQSKSKADQKCSNLISFTASA